MFSLFAFLPTLHTIQLDCHEPSGYCKQGQHNRGKGSKECKCPHSFQKRGQLEVLLCVGVIKIVSFFFHLKQGITWLHPLAPPRGSSPWTPSSPGSKDTSGPPRYLNFPPIYPGATPYCKHDECIRSHDISLSCGSVCGNVNVGPAA